MSMKVQVPVVTKIGDEKIAGLIKFRSPFTQEILQNDKEGRIVNEIGDDVGIIIDCREGEITWVGYGKNG